MNSLIETLCKFRPGLALFQKGVLSHSESLNYLRNEIILTIIKHFRILMLIANHLYLVIKTVGVEQGLS